MRIPLIPQLSSRDSSGDKDDKVVNSYLEFDPATQAPVVVKRPGTGLSTANLESPGQGIFGCYALQNDKLVYICSTVKAAGLNVNTVGYTYRGLIGQPRSVVNTNTLASVKVHRVSGMGFSYELNGNPLALLKDGSLLSFTPSPVYDGTRIPACPIIHPVFKAWTWASVSRSSILDYYPPTDASGTSGFFAIRTDGTLWGLSEVAPVFGVFRDPAQVLIDPSVVGTFSNSDWSFVSSNANMYAIKTDGSLWAFISAGLGYVPRTLIPADPTSSSWRYVFSGVALVASPSVYPVFALKTDGTLWVGGGDGSANVGQLGLGPTVGQADFPTQVGSAAWLKIVGNNGSTVGIQADGTLWGWGTNTNGELGLGDTNPRYVPTQIGVASTWKDVSLGLDHLAAMKADGTVYTCGDNSSGQLADGSYVNNTTLTAVSGVTGADAVYAGWQSTFVSYPTSYLKYVL